MGHACCAVPAVQGGLVGTLVPPSADAGSAAAAAAPTAEEGTAYGGVFIGDVRLSGGVN